MSFRYYKAYLNSWGGQQIVACVPEYGGEVSYTGWVSNVNDLITNGIAVPKIALFCAGAQNYYNKLIGAGFTNCYNVLNGIHLKIYVTQNNYFDFDGITMAMYASGVLIGTYRISTTYNSISLLGLDGSYFGCNNYGGRGVNVVATTISSLASLAETMWEGAVETTGDPYGDGGGTSGTGGGTGDFDGTGDNIDIPSLPTLSAVDTGFITLFNPSAGELRSLANYMWSNPLFDLNAWKKIFADPMDAILGLSIVPVAVPNGGAICCNSR